MTIVVTIVLTIVVTIVMIVLVVIDCVIYYTLFCNASICWRISFDGWLFHVMNNCLPFEIEEARCEDSDGSFPTVDTIITCSILVGLV